MQRGPLDSAIDEAFDAAAEELRRNTRTASEAIAGDMPDKATRIANLFFDTDSETRARGARGGSSGTFGRLAPSPESISATIASLESLTETIPAILQVANGWSPAGTAFRNRDSLISAVEMLRNYRRDRIEREHISDSKAITAALEKARAEGIALGIEQEKQRVKEARRARAGK